MSVGAAQTQQSYSTLLARLKAPPDYRFPDWPLGRMTDEDTAGR